MKQITITTFTDPMMGLSYECEPMYERLKDKYGNRLHFRYAMAVLVRNVHDFMIPADYGETEAETIRNYNRRLAQIYKSEEHIGGLPINMDNFRLFDEQHTTSEPLCLAYKAVEHFAPEQAEAFLYALRRATIVETRPTTHWDEILRVVRCCNIDEQVFEHAYHSSEVREALREDINTMNVLGICQLPVCLLQFDNKQLLISPLVGFDLFSQTIEQLSRTTDL